MTPDTHSPYTTPARLETHDPYATAYQALRLSVDRADHVYRAQLAVERATRTAAELDAPAASHHIAQCRAEAKAAAEADTLTMARCHANGAVIASEDAVLACLVAHREQQREQDSIEQQGEQRRDWPTDWP